MSRRPSPLQSYLASHRRGIALILLFLTVWWIWDWYQRPDLVTRILFCETANCTPLERLLVAG